MMQVSDLSEADRAANAGAAFLPADAGGKPGDLYMPPRVLLSGIWVSVYARDGVAVLEVDTDGADPEVFRMTENGGGKASPALAVNLGEGKELLATTGPQPVLYEGRHAKAGA